jgi:hypothetical protein
LQVLVGLHISKQKYAMPTMGGEMKYRNLRQNEIIRKGDEYKYMWSDRWYPSTAIGYKVSAIPNGAVYRRPIKKRKSKGKVTFKQLLKALDNPIGKGLQDCKYLIPIKRKSK